MPESRSRRLAAILAADIAGYSALMGADEARTVTDLKAHQAAVLPKVAEFDGRIIDTAGDGILAEFASVVRAVECALAIQAVMGERNASVDPARRMQFRIGINLGDVIYDEARIYGDGVNVAARLESIAAPGGICLSEDAYRQARGKLDVTPVDGGLQPLKNIAEPVRVFYLGPALAAGARQAAQPHKEFSPRRVSLFVGAFIVLLALLGGAASFFWRHGPGGAPATKAGAQATPIIAVLPFANQIGDESQDYLVDGLSEEVINALGRFNTLRVIGRNAVWRYKKRPPSQQEVASELGASYLVEGSVRRSGDQLRVTAQMSEARGGTVIWTDRFDGKVSNAFDVQDAIAQRIAGTLAANIKQVESRRSLDQARPDPGAFDWVLRARAIGHSANRATNRRFREQVATAIELDPRYAAAHALMADALYSQAILGWTEFSDQTLSRGAEEARKAIELAPDQPDGYRALGRILLVRAEYDQAKDALKRAVDLNPSDAGALADWGSAQSFTGHVAEAIETLQLALKLDPTLEPKYVFDLAVANYLARRHEDALRVAARGLERYPDFPMFNAVAAAAAARLGRREQASGYLEALRRRLPVFDLDSLGSRFTDPTLRAYLRDGVKLAGY